MSFSNDGFNTSSNTTGRNEGFTRGDNEGIESYGQGTGAGAFDPANTGLGGYGAGQQRASDTTQTDNFGNRDYNRTTVGGNDLGTDDLSSSGTGAFGRDRGLEKPGFTGSDSQYSNTTTGQTFNQRSSTNVGGQNDFDNTSNSQRGLDNLQDRERGLDNIQDRERDRSDFDSTGSRDHQFGNEAHAEREGGKATFGDKMRGK
jgi:hypothetical protein